MDIASGAPEQHPTVLPLADSGPGISPVAWVTPVTGGLTGPTYDGRSYVGTQAEDVTSGTAACAAAMSDGMTAETDRRHGYQAQALPLGGHIGDQPVIPAVPDASLPPAQSYDYPWPADEPVPASAGLATYPNTGDQPQ
jgi:hypothetical protein